MPEICRRSVLATLGAASAAALVTLRAWAEEYPSKDMSFIIPDGAGGGFDSYVRALAPALEKHLPQKVRVIPTNVPGAGGARAATEIFRAKPDGYAIGIFNVPGIYIQQERGGTAFDLIKLSWLGRAGVDYYGLAVGTTSAVKTIDDLRALAKQRPIKFTSTGPAGTAYNATLIAAHLLGLRPQLITGYKGSSDYVMGAVRGDGDAVITVLPTLRRMAAGGTLRILATFEQKSSIEGAADANTLGQPELAQITLQRLIGGPPALPADVKQALAGALARALTDPDVQNWARKADAGLAPETPEEATATLNAQIAFYNKWKPILNSKT